jgi:hypothetical protein
MIIRQAAIVLTAFLFLSTASESQSSSALPSEKYDVVIISGSSSGIGAALGAARLGVKVVLVEDTPVLGGMLSNGIGNTDSMSVQAMSGVFRDFTDQVKAYYAPIMQRDELFKVHYRRSLPPELEKLRAPIETRKNGITTSGVMDPDEGGRWEPHVADKILKEMASHYPNLKIYYTRHAERVIVRDQKVTGVVTYENTLPNAYASAKPGTGLILYGEAIVDATHEGDIATWAGVPYRIGREPRTRLEPHAGSIYFFDHTGEILPGSTGQQDPAVVSYGERITLQYYDDAHYKAHLIDTPPAGYDQKNYEHSVYVPSKNYNPNLKTEVNEYPFGSEIEQLNWKWAEASRDDRERLYNRYRDYALGFAYYLQSVKGYSHWGLPQDDYTDNGHVPYRIYVRESRRMVGEYTISEPDINPFIIGSSKIQPVHEDSVAVGHYPIDCKPSYTKVDVSMPDKGNGDFYLTNATEPFQIPYAAMLPQHVDGILFPTAMSATHVAFCATRLDPTWTVSGQAAGVAAALSAKEHVELRAVPIGDIQKELLKQKSELIFYWDLPLDHPALRAIQWLGVKKVVTGYPDRLFRPDQDITRAELAKLLVLGLDIWPSVSNVHFSDVPQEYWGFRFIETLYDNGALEPFGVQPLWPKYGPWDKLEVKGSSYNQESGFSKFEPESPVTWKAAIGVIHALQTRLQQAPSAEGEALPVVPIQDPAAWANEVLSGSMFGTAYAEEGFDINQPMTRGQAAALIAALTDKAPSGHISSENSMPTIR